MDGHELERLAHAAHLTGRDEDADTGLAEAHQAWLRDGDPVAAARCAFWLGLGLLLRGDEAQGEGWLTRAQRLVDEAGDTDGAVQGLLLVPLALERLGDGDADGALATFERALVIGERARDLDVVTLGRLGCGQALIAKGETAAGSSQLDEAMVAVTAGEVSPTVAGIVYCAVLLECHSTFDVRRAREWTEAFSRWCDAQPDLVPYRGQCLVHRSEVLQLRGEWPGALDEAQRACERLAGHPAIGDAYYQQAELHRVRGELTAADASYRAANQWGRDPQPGLALLRLAQGRVDVADASIRRALEEARDRPTRARLLPAAVEVALAAGAVDAARAAADELLGIGAEAEAPLLHALAASAEGAVLLAEGDAGGALAPLRRAWRSWQEIGAPYEAARARLLIGLGCRALGDDDSAAMELDAARGAFADLGADADLARAAELVGGGGRRRPGGLTAREAEVLALVAAGQTNHEIATALVVSDHTVRRHLQNIFAKIGVTSRAAATAYAFRHDLV